MRIPPRLIVESERPLMIAVSRSVISIQSPWRHTPGNISKYDSRSLDPSSSPQKKIGIDGIGSVMTSSPTSPMCGLPSSSQDSIFAPSERPCSSPRYTGSVGTPPTNAAHMSVPPLVENSHVCEPSLSYTHWKPSGDSGDPVDPTDRSALRSRPAAGSTPAFMHAAMYAALVPKQVMPAFSARSQSTPMSGEPGLPS